MAPPFTEDQVVRPPRPAPSPPTGLYSPVAADVVDLQVDGELPAELDGAYVRSGPNPRFPPDGAGVLLSGGRARYANRIVRTPIDVEEERVGPAVTVVRHGGRLLALTDPALETLERETFNGLLPAGVCAHPKIDPATGEVLAFCCNSRPPFLTWTTVAPDGLATAPRPVEGVERPSVIHDMAITERYVVLVVAPLRSIAGSAPAWDPSAGTRIALVPRDGGPVRWCEDDTFWLWHTVNAHAAKDVTDPMADVVVLDYVEWDEPSASTKPRLSRASLDPAAGTVRRETLSDLAVELPRIDDRFLGRAHRVSAFVMRTDRPHSPPGCWDALAWYDTRSREVIRWVPTDLAVGEPSFAPDPRSDAADRGWWLSLVTGLSTGESSLLVIPAADPGSGPIATVRIPVRVPLGLHGNWMPTAD